MKIKIIANKKNINFIFSMIILTILFNSCSSKKGVITGYISYPGQEIPNDLKVCAINIETGRKFCVQYTDTVYHSYTIKVPEGIYYVYATTNKFEKKAYYTEFVKCGLKIDCPSHEKIKILVKSNDTIKNINPQDWYE